MDNTKVERKAELLGTILFLGFGVALLLASGLVVYFRRRTLRKAGLVKRTETMPASAIGGRAPGTLVEVKGILRCEEPLVSEMARMSCAYYSSVIKRRYSRRGADGDRKSSWETLSDSRQFAPFSVEDGSGAVMVDAQGAEVDGREVVDRFERHREGNTLGIRHQEHILAVDEPVYVLGVVKEGGKIGSPLPEEADKRFIVSYRSEEELVHSYLKNARILGLVAVGLLLMGLIFTAIGVAAALGYIEFEPTSSTDTM